MSVQGLVPKSPSGRLAALFAVTGVAHLVVPDLYRVAMPSWVPAHREVIIWSGVAELACAAGLALPQTRQGAGYASTALLVGVYPANLKMAYDSLQSPNRLRQILMLGRLPLQWPMIRAAWSATRAR